MKIRKNINSSVTAAVFDLDGTLLDTIDTINHYLNLALSKSALGSLTREETMRSVGDGARNLVLRALSHLGASEVHFDRVFRDYNEAYDAAPYYLTRLYPGICEMLACLKKEGVRLAVLSNKPDFATREVVNYFFPSTFDFVCGARADLPLKPDPAPLYALLSDMGSTRENSAYIGDSETDYLTARAADVRLPMLVSWGFCSREELSRLGSVTLIDSPGEILNLIKNHSPISTK